MSKVCLPYSKKTIEIQIDDKNLVGVLRSRAEDYKPQFGEAEIVERAFDNPIASPKLEDLVKGKKIWL